MCLVCLARNRNIIYCDGNLKALNRSEIVSVSFAYIQHTHTHTLRMAA